MARGDDAYTLEYKSTQLGDELVVLPAPRLRAQPATVVPLYGVERAAIHRATPGKSWQYRCRVLVIEDTAHEAVQAIRGWYALANDTPGSLVVKQNLNTPATIDTFTNLYLDEINEQVAEEPGRARILPVELVFLGTDDPS